MTSSTGKNRGRSCGAGGFTLLELVLVMALVCSMLAIVAPSLAGFAAARQTADAARQIISLIQYARTQAVAQGCIYRLNFDRQAGEYWLTARNGADFESLGSDFGNRFALPQGTSFDLRAGTGGETASGAAAEVPDFIDFYPNGAASPLIIRLTGRKGDACEVASPSLTEAYRVVVPVDAAGERL